MLSGFTTKKIFERTSLGETFKEARKQKGFSLAQAEAGARVKLEYLKALENGDWNGLPCSVYVRGFVLAYSKYLELEPKKILDLFETECNANNRDGKSEFAYKQLLQEKRLIITPRLLGYFSLTIAILSMIGYLGYQVMSFVGSPNLEVVTPMNNSVIELDATNISGVTEIDTVLTVNNEKISISNDGHFSANVKLQRGINVIKVRAENKTKKETTEVLTVEYRPKTAEATMINGNN